MGASGSDSHPLHLGPPGGALGDPGAGRLAAAQALGAALRPPTEDVTAFAGALLRRLGRGIVLVMDRLQAHRSAARRLQKRFPKRLHIAWLPPYAPDLNPVEQVWGQTKHRDPANYIPDDLDELRGAVGRSLRHTREEQPLLRSFFKHAKLSL